MQDHAGGLNAIGLDIAVESLEEALEALVGPAGKWRETRDVQLRMLDSLGLQRHHRLLDLGCGSLRAGLALIRYLDQAHYTGVDSEPACIEAGRLLVEQFDLTSRQPALFIDDDFGRSTLPVGAFDRIWCFQVVIHLDEQQVRMFIAAAARLLASGGRVWFTARMPVSDIADQGEPEFVQVGGWKRFPVTAANVAFFRQIAAKFGLETHDHGPLSQWGMDGNRHAANNRLIEFIKR